MKISGFVDLDTLVADSGLCSGWMRTGGNCLRASTSKPDYLLNLRHFRPVNLL